jgi:adenylate kinase
MIVFFGPVGAGKSVQGQMLADRLGWRWLSTGQIFRASEDPEMIEFLKTGQLVSDEMTIRIVGEAFEADENSNEIILDGFPRMIDQAKWLVETRKKYGHDINLIVAIDVPKDELVKRLSARGRDDDAADVLEERLNIYTRDTQPILSYLEEQGIAVAHIDGVGEIKAIHERIFAAVSEHGIA